MNKKILTLIVFIIILFVTAGCQNEPVTTNELSSQAPTAESGYLAQQPQNGMILHAWNWSMETVENHLEEIAIAGFSSVQISPMQPQKDYFGVASWESSWWKLYQPLGFSIATEKHVLGTEEDLRSLTEASDQYGIKIIVDVIANHLASGEDQPLNQDVQAFEPEIYNQQLYRMDNGMTSDNSIFSVVRGSLLGLPDLKTENDLVQAHVLDLLKAYVNAGVDGFRFDAAKHIETPYDEQWASDFWPVVINGVHSYADDNNHPGLFIYGEILNTAGMNRSYGDYTPFMSVTTNQISEDIRGAVVARDVSRLVTLDYLDDVPADKTVLWPESHDTFASGLTDGLSHEMIAKIYAIEASRNHATTLYLARPKDTTFIGAMGSPLWQSIQVTSVNRFHNFMIGTHEDIRTEEGLFLNERYLADKQGVIIVDVENTGEVSNITLNHLDDGHYKDQISGEWFTVKNGKISGEISDLGVAVVYNNPYEPKPVVYVSDDGSYGSFTDTKTITIHAYNTTEASYSINGGEQISFSGDQDVQLIHPDQNATVTLDLVVAYGDYEITKHYEYTKSNITVDEVTVNNLDTSMTDGQTIVAWTWEPSEEGQWVEGTYNDGTFTFDLPEGHDYFLLVTFPEGTTTYDWADKIAQTNDVQVPSDGTYDGSTLIWG